MMKLWEKKSGHIDSSEIHTQFGEHYDVIVVGLGTAGSFAAMQAARKGLRVLAIERLNGMGGTGTLGGVAGYYYGTRGGIYEQIDEQVTKYQKQDDFLPFKGMHSELKSWVLDTEIASAGAEVHYLSYVIGVYMQDRTVTGLRWVSPAGIHQSSARIVIDCSGNAEVCEMAGCAFQLGRSIDGQPQPFSNVVFKLYENQRVGNFYTDSGYIDITNPEDVTSTILESNRLPTHLKEQYTEQSMLLKTNQLLGVRETRTIVGEAQVTLKDYLDDRLTTEPAFYAYSNLDNHGKDIAFESDTQQQWLVAASLWGLNFSVPIPAGTLIPKGYDGLLAAGRSLSVDHDIAACVRQKRDMQKSGETAANLAYLAISDSVRLSEIPYKKLQALQLETGCLSLDSSIELRDTTPQEHTSQASNSQLKWLTDIEAIRTALSTDKPGIAIWSVRRLGAAYDSLLPSLIEWIQTGQEELLRKNSAIALGMLGHAASLPILREMVVNRDLYVPRSSRKYNQPHVFTAIYLLGTMKDQEVMPELLTILDDASFIDTTAVDNKNQEFIFDTDELYFQFFSFSFIAALRIADAYEVWKIPVADTIERRLKDPHTKLSVTLKNSSQDVTATVRKEMKGKIEQIFKQHIKQWDSVSSI
ncbi:FAD-dependent oxidoreductase [Paenibacillus sp. FSL H8-0034]|uniref:FAD-dependent oxidoreductase n=1 Tax=Paenibacillus sp. FSL H8-0034 TaxID=2954671 RepID=UPI0030FB3FDC